MNKTPLTALEQKVFDAAVKNAEEVAGGDFGIVGVGDFSTGGLCLTFGQFGALLTSLQNKNYIEVHDPVYVNGSARSRGTRVVQFTIVRDEPPVADLAVGGGGTVYTVIAGTDAGRRWLAENIGTHDHWLGSALVVEHRFITDIVDGARADGLIVR